jgi:hypothetical protein
MPIPQPVTDGYELPAFLESVAIPLSRENTQRDTLRSAMAAFWRYADRGVSETLMTAASAASGVDGRALWNAAREWCSVGHIEGVTDPSGSTVALLFAVPVLMYLDRPEKRSMTIDTQQLYRTLCDNGEWVCPGDRCAILPNLVPFHRLPSTPDATRQMFNAMAWNAAKHRWQRSLPVGALPKPPRRHGSRGLQDELWSLYFAVGIAVVDMTTPLFSDIRDAARIWEPDLAATWATALGVADIDIIHPMPYFLQSISMGFSSFYARELLYAVEDASDNVSVMNRAGGLASPDIVISLHAEDASRGDGVRLAFSTGATTHASCVWRVPPDGSYATLFASIRHLSQNYGFRMDKSVIDVSPISQKRLC